MDKKRIIANWKSNKTAVETLLFLDTLQAAWSELPTQDKEVIILPSFTSISTAYVYKETEGLPVSIGAQDIAAQGVGAYTGEVNGKQIAEFCRFVLINHSERKRYFHEGDQEARAKVAEALKYNLTPLYCVQNENDVVPDGVTDIVYEPPTSISTYTAGAKVEDAATIEHVFTVLKGRYPEALFYYGGSVSSENVANLFQIPHTSGVLIGNASLSVDSFSNILSAC